MYIHRVVLENICCFERLDLTFERPDSVESERYRGWNVITGDNAAGKSTLLKAISLALVGPEIARALQSSLAGWTRDGADKGTISIEISTSELDRFSVGARPKMPFAAELELTRRGTDVALFSGKRKSAAKARGPSTP